MRLNQASPVNGYYLVTETGQIWSSKRATYVADDDAEYLKYSKLFMTTIYPTEASLTAYLSRYGIAGPGAV